MEVGELITRACRAFGVSEAAFYAGDRHAEVVKARECVILILRDRQMRVVEIGRFLNIDHSSVLAAYQRAIRNDVRFQETVEIIKAAGTVEPPPKAPRKPAVHRKPKNVFRKAVTYWGECYVRL